MSKHTPGPWSVDGEVIRGDEQSNGSVSVACILDGAYPYGRRAGKSARANARLIAAAPELLEALNNLLSACDLPGDRDREIEQAIPHARAAIAKAKGETK